MAKFIPRAPAHFNNSDGEEAIFRAFAALPGDTWVFYSLRWVGETKRKAQGEADFVVISPEHGVLVIEVKGGQIRYENGEWLSIDRATGKEIDRGDPEKQADISKWHLMSRAHNRLPFAETPLFGHAVWFPDVKVGPKTPLPPQLVRELVLDKDDLADPAAAVARAMTYWSNNTNRTNKLSEAGAGLLVRLFAPTFSLVPSLRDDWAAADAKLEQLTAEQKRILEFLDDQRVATIAGTAGTGKTFLAVEKARRLSDAGGSTLVLCFNRPLRDFLHARNKIPNVDFLTLHQFTAQVLRRPITDTTDVGEALASWLADDANELPYNHVVIDEGQDLPDDVIEYLQFKTVGHFYVFYDRYQHVRPTDHGHKWLLEADCRLTLTRNCRNTKHICRTAYRTAGLDVRKAEANVGGEKAQLHACASTKEARERVARIVQTALTGGIPAEDIAVLTLQAVQGGLLYGAATVASRAASPDPETGKITVTSVRRFKGLEAGLVILTDVRLGDLERDDVRALLYVGASRARQQLHLICMNVDDDALKTAVTALRTEKATGTRRGVERALDAVWVDD